MRFRRIPVLFALGLMVTATMGFQYIDPKQTLFDPQKAPDNFAHMQDLFPAAPIAASSHPLPLPRSIRPLPEFISIGTRPFRLNDLLDRTRTTSLTVIRKGTILAETFQEGYDDTSRATSFSVAKSFVGTLIGVALHKGWINGLSDGLTEYLPELEDTAWDGVTIENVLQMSSGIDFSEDYDDPGADAYTIFDSIFKDGKAIDELAASYPRRSPPGDRFHYASINTHILAMLLRKVSGKSLPDLLQSELWEPLGAEEKAYWLTDLEGTAVGFWGLNALPRDYARLGLLMLSNGKAPDGTQLLPENWVKRATTPDRASLWPGAINSFWGYQYHWWVPAPAFEKDYAAIGIWGQFIYVDRQNDVVIVKTSADPDFWIHDYDTISGLRALSAWAARQPLP
jgi:CubicO group peptidase (beta-lactamase class C family)